MRKIQILGLLMLLSCGHESGRDGAAPPAPPPPPPSPWAEVELDGAPVRFELSDHWYDAQFDRTVILSQTSEPPGYQLTILWTGDRDPVAVDTTTFDGLEVLMLDPAGDAWGTTYWVGLYAQAQIQQFAIEPGGFTAATFEGTIQDYQGWGQTIQLTGGALLARRR